MNIDYEELVDGAIDEIDAALFSGDTFHDEEAIEDFRRIMERWKDDWWKLNLFWTRFWTRSKHDYSNTSKRKNR